MMHSIEVLLCYAQLDKAKIEGLKPHLGLSRRQNFFAAWHDCPIIEGVDSLPEIREHLRRMHIKYIIVLVVSPLFLNSDSCFQVYSEEMMTQYKERETTVVIIPVILTPCYYRRTPFAKLQLLPARGKAITKWHNRDEAFDNVADGIRKAAQHLHSFDSK